MGKKIYFDGGCKPNPGMMEVCIVLVDGNNTEPLAVPRLGKGTNNIAEWSALLWATQTAIERGWKDVEIIGDSNLVVMQAGGKWKIKQAEFNSFKATYDKLSANLNVKLKHVLRNKNLAGRYLESAEYLKQR